MVGKFEFLLVLGVCALLAGLSQAEETKREQKDNMEHLFPLLFLMGGAPSVCSPAVWLVGILGLAVVWFVGPAVKVKNS